MTDGTSSRVLEPKYSGPHRMCTRLRDLIGQLFLWFRKFLEKAWNIGRTDPRKVMHCLKVGMALSLVSLFYYMRPLYDGVGGNAMWAVMTVVVVFEYTVGATLQKCVNRAIGTFLAGSLGVGVHWIASKSGKELEPVILQGSVFLLATAATFSRFIPSVKARFDYGAMIFILTFSLVSVSGYRVDKLLELAHERLSTIAIGASICIFTTTLFCPVWAGQELHSLVLTNIQKLADSLDASTAEYFKNDDQVEADDVKDGGVSRKNGYTCVLNSKATEEAMANFARWEPAHGNFNFRHPWKLYLKIGASTRCCAYHIEALNSNISSKTQIPEFLKMHLSRFCKKLSTDSSSVLSEVANVMRTMTKSSKIDLFVGEMHFALEDLQNALKSLPNHSISPPAGTVQPSCNTTVKTYRKPDIVVPVVEIVPLVTIASLLIEIAARVQEIMESVNELASQAEFEPGTTKTTDDTNKSNQHNGDNQDNVTIPTSGKV